jgi:hypothetical protein
VSLKVSASRALRDALALPDKEPFERSLGNAVRHHGGSYEDYVDLMSQVRETARKRKVSVREAARILADQP